MAKILLVEDDNNLREIYEARLQAEGYTIVSARDGEEALVVAKAQQPDLVISDVMMPKISGFEMLDILRNTEGLKDVKVVMLTALGQSEDQSRADSLGADRYLVKSQVTLEDIVNSAKQLLSEDEPTAADSQMPPTTTIPVVDTPVVDESTVAVAPAPTAAPIVEPAATPELAVEPEPATDVPSPVIPLTPAPPEDEPTAADSQMPPTTTIPVVDTPVVEESTVPVAPAPTAAPIVEPDEPEPMPKAAPAEQISEPEATPKSVADPEPVTASVETAPEPAVEAAPATDPITVEPSLNLDSNTADTLDQEESIIEKQLADFVTEQTGNPPLEAPVDETPTPQDNSSEVVPPEPAVAPELAIEPEPTLATPLEAVAPEAAVQTTSTDNTPEQEKALAEAVNSLSAPTTEGETEPSKNAQVTPPTQEPKLVGGSNKKIIEPLGAAPAQSKKSLEQLLAEEDAQAGTSTPPAADIKGDFDPNSIAL